MTWLCLRETVWNGCAEIREGQHSIRSNDQYRVCFEWREVNAYEVEITDYH